MKKLIVLFIITLFFACSSDTDVNTNIVTPKVTKIETPDFNSDSAYIYIEKQVSFGPRVPNTKEHLACADYLSTKLKDFGAEVIVQDFNAIAYDGSILKSKNIIGQYNIVKKNRILLFAHWDTRPFADYDEDVTARDKAILGANDGASGVGVLLEIARQLGNKLPNLGIDIIFFDSEDYGQPDHKNLPYKENTWCLGSQYWSKNPHIIGYSARFGILLDMVGAKNAFFTKEGTSYYYAPGIVDKVWNAASKLGYSDYFLFQKTNPVTDDHLYVNQIANIPSIDIIQHDPTSKSGFGKYWHTHSDNMEVIDKGTLKAVGQTVLEVIFSEE